MVGIVPPRLNQIEVLSTSDTSFWTEGSDSDPWFNYPYQWTVTFSVNPTTHSDPTTREPFYYTGSDVTIGDWISTGSNGSAVKIVDIIDQNDVQVTALLEDVDRFNTFSDVYQGGFGGINTGPGYLFTVNEDGSPILLGVAPGIMPDSYQTDLISRFNYRNFFSKYIRVNQPGHTFVNGDIVRVTIAGTFEAAQADSKANAAIGIVNSIGIPSESWFTFRPLCQVINDVEPPLIGNYGDLFFIDPANPGKLTTTIPEVNARPIYMRLDAPNRAILLDAGMFDYVLNNPGETNKYDVTEFDAGQTEFQLPNDCVEVLYMSINGIENENFTFDLLSKVLTFDPVETGYGVDVDDEIFFFYKT